MNTHIIKKPDIVYLDGDLTLYHNPKLQSTILELIDELKIDQNKKGEIINQLLIRKYDNSFEKMAHDIAKMGGKELDPTISNKIKKLEKQHLKEIEGFELYPDSIDFLKELKSMKIKTALASNATEFYRLISRKLFSLDKILDYLYLSCELGYAKLDKSFYHKILQDTGTLAKNATMIGDNVKADIFAAKDAGLQPIHIIRWGDASNADYFSEHLKTNNTQGNNGSYPVVKNLEEALQHIKNRK